MRQGVDVEASSVQQMEMADRSMGGVVTYEFSAMVKGAGVQ
jgi:hypothetical protein